MYNWENQNWELIEGTVHNFQQQIYLATKAGNISAARNLQNMLLNMYEPRLLAVKTVTTNSGGKTPGYDNWIAITDEDKFKLANELILDGEADIIRRVHIPKPGTNEKRPLGIPTIKDRAKQCFVKLLIEPEWEAKFESNSFGFRPDRSPIDAVAKIRAHLIFKGPCYVLETDIKKCFDKINHQTLINKLNALPIISNQIQAWLTAGILDKDKVIFPKEGTPQGGIISPLLANVALDGLQNILSQQIKLYCGNDYQLTYYVRYADDLVCFAPKPEIIAYIKTLITYNLNFMGLEMKAEKTRELFTLTKLDNGKFKSEHFDFLGFRFKQRVLSKHIIHKSGGKISPIRTYVLVSQSRIERHKASITYIMKELGSVSVKKLIDTLNPRIIGWTNYFKFSDGKEYGDLPRKMDIWLNSKIRKWIRKSSKLRGKDEKYWKQDTKDWILYYKDDQGNEVTLAKYNSVKWSIYDYKAIDTRFSKYNMNYNEFKNWKKQLKG